MAITSKPISKQEYRKRCAEIISILNSPFKISETVRKELESKFEKYKKIAYE